MAITIRVNIPNLTEAKMRFAMLPVQTIAELNKAIRKSALLVEYNAKRELGGSNGGWDTGRMANSIISKFGVLRAVIAPGVSYAIYVHEGTRPHWAPISAIAPWARRHGLNPYAVQSSIAYKGTKANPFMERAASASEHDIEKIFMNAVEDIVKSV